MYFASDNTSGVPDRILTALGKANSGYALGYGADAFMDQVRTRIRALFEAPEAEVFLVTTGSAANALALASYCPPWGAVYCHSLAHIEVDECGAPEFYTGGAKLTHVAGDNGKMNPDALQDALARAGRGVVHHVQPGILSLTNLTECGTRYSVSEISELSAIARSHGLPVHMDGARFANALVAEGCSPADMTWRAGVDVLSLGGTKNGLMGVEAVVLFDPAQAWEFQLRRKRGGHLLSKHRFLSAQMAAWLEDDLWLELARDANAMAAQLEKGLEGCADLLFERGGNMLFAQWPRGLHRQLQSAGAQYYLWPDHQDLDGLDHAPLSARLVCSWNTQPDHVGEFVRRLKIHA
ncbi:threonine aldolase family protein [Roseinatronobacter bogoriensis]|uniref:L-threonine aldolase n=1 Tax=Roseinatronobacter bogoriensis subsp. barguzinensis TaxID=441209 RepID=A0A2K8KJJ2_9RHOB|nr:MULTISPECIES: beta-eliminating lyase-related protein [Rhodobaca]ATX66440.1 low specificity L-threonine aldolase [Rhodobaca barguzinensis]MBB4207585.1 threonine aldolase [Rhodobaca bogoriensis DSM 18756]TDW40108.1 L-threonine aldolase [Rhodobaca barguzinensis]TDY70740.1 L-threonine aldolase [Rhodobaca bogoriensis DSM 18756]